MAAILALRTGKAVVCRSPASWCLSRLSLGLFIKFVFWLLFLFFGILFLSLFFIFLTALVSHYVPPFHAVQNIFSQCGFCCNHSRPIFINCNLAYFLKPVNYRFKEAEMLPGSAVTPSIFLLGSSSRMDLQQGMGNQSKPSLKLWPWVLPRGETDGYSIKLFCLGRPQKVLLTLTLILYLNCNTYLPRR